MIRAAMQNYLQDEDQGATQNMKENKVWQILYEQREEPSSPAATLRSLSDRKGNGLSNIMRLSREFSLDFFQQTNPGQGETERAVLVQPGEEKAHRGFQCCFNLMGAYRGDRTRLHEQDERTRHTRHKLQFRKFLFTIISKVFVTTGVVEQWRR